MRIAVAVVGCMAMLVANAGAQTGKPLQWIINGPALKYFASDATARAFFAGKQPFVIQRKDARTQLPPQWQAREVRSFTSFASMQSAIRRGLGPNVRAVIYDNEVWRFTPPEEQRDSVTYTQRAAQLAHEHGLMLIATPAVNLVRAMTGRPARGNRYQEFLDLNVIGGAAKYADAVDIQAQGSETALPRFTQFVRAAADQARAANPRVLVFAGISTNPNGQAVTADHVLRAIEATRNIVDGYWLNVPAPGPYCPSCNDFRPDVALDVLQKVDSR